MTAPGNSDYDYGNDRNFTPYWYAAYTRSRFEKKVATQLMLREVEYFLPLLPTLRQWKDRKKIVEMPLFSGYVLVRIPLHDRVKVLSADGVVSLVSFNGKPARIPDSQIDDVRKIMSSPETVETANYFKEGDWVELIYGPFAGVKGRLFERHGERRLLVGIDLINQAISIEVDMSWVKCLKNLQTTPIGVNNV